MPGLDVFGRGLEKSDVRRLKQQSNKTMIHNKQGNLLLADVDALVNTVNCVGVMGKGLALQFKQANPDNFKA